MYDIACRLVDYGFDWSFLLEAELTFLGSCYGLLLVKFCEFLADLTYSGRTG